MTNDTASLAIAGSVKRTRLQLLSELSVQKLGYSSRPWRLVDPQGFELYSWEPYPGGGNLPPIEAPVCFDRKRDAVAKLNELVAAARADELNAGVALVTPAASLAIAEELAVYLQGANPGWTHEPVPGAVVPTVVSESRPCICGKPDCAERDDDGSLRVGDQVRVLPDGLWQPVDIVSENFVSVAGVALRRRLLARDMAEGCVEWRRGEEVGS